MSETNQPMFTSERYTPDTLQSVMHKLWEVALYDPNAPEDSNGERRKRLLTLHDVNTESHEPRKIQSRKERIGKIISDLEFEKSKLNNPLCSEEIVKDRIIKLYVELIAQCEFIRKHNELFEITDQDLEYMTQLYDTAQPASVTI